MLFTVVFVVLLSVVLAGWWFYGMRVWASFVEPVVLARGADRIRRKHSASDRAMWNRDYPQAQVRDFPWLAIDWPERWTS